MRQGKIKVYINVFALVMVLGIMIVSAYRSFGENTNQSKRSVSNQEIIEIYN